MRAYVQTLADGEELEIAGPLHAIRFRVLAGATPNSEATCPRLERNGNAGAGAVVLVPEITIPLELTADARFVAKSATTFGIVVATTPEEARVLA